MRPVSGHGDEDIVTFCLRYAIEQALGDRDRPCLAGSVGERYSRGGAVGYVFYVDPGPAPGTSRAYFGPEVKVGIPQPALSINLDAHSNVETLSFSLDTEEKRLPVTFIQELVSKLPIPIPVPDVSVLNPPLGVVPLPAKKVEYVTDSAKRSAVQAVLHAMARAAASAAAHRPEDCAHRRPRKR